MYLASRAEVPVTWCFQADEVPVRTRTVPRSMAGCWGERVGTASSFQCFHSSLPSLEHTMFPRLSEPAKPKALLAFYSLNSSKCIKTKGASNIFYKEGSCPQPLTPRRTVCNIEALVLSYPTTPPQLQAAAHPA